MTPFTAVVRWDDRRVTVTDRAESALSALPLSSIEGRKVVAVPGAILAVGLKLTVPGETVAHGFAIDPREQWAAVGDVSLYDRQALTERLGGGTESQTDLELLARTFRRFGPKAVAAVAGDFALVIWDWRLRQVQAIRDHFGMRPVFYRTRSDGIELAGSVTQLLALDQGDRAIDAVMARGYLMGRISTPENTFFSSIKALRPAGWLDARAGMARQSVYWTPQFTPFRGSYADALAEWRYRFRMAVRSRLRAHGPVAAYLSGGFDSSSVVGATEEALAEEGFDASERPLALSASFTGFPCDERSFRESMLERCPTFDSFVWDGRQPNPDDFDEPHCEAPGLRQGIGRSPKNEYAAMRERNCRVLLTGDGGDALGLGYGVLGDLFLNGRWATLVHELRSLRTWSRIRRVARIEAADVLRMPRRSPPPPVWLAPALRDLSPWPFPRAVLYRGPSLVQTNVSDTLTTPFVAHAVGAVVSAAAINGFQVRAPYLDIRLAELVLALPWQYRLPGGDFRRLQREGAAPFLSEVVRIRPGKVGFGAMLEHQFRANSARIGALFHGREWLSGPYVSQASAQAALDGFLKKNAHQAAGREAGGLWRIAVFEAWLRHVLGYSPPNARVEHTRGPSGR